MIKDLLTDPDIVQPTVIRRVVSEVSERGRLTESGGSVETIQASVQPSTPEERETLPDGERDKDAVTIWTLAALDDAVRLDRADRVYAVQGVEAWDTPQGRVTRGVATLVGVNG